MNIDSGIDLLIELLRVGIPKMNIDSGIDLPYSWIACVLSLCHGETEGWL